MPELRSLQEEVCLALCYHMLFEHSQSKYKVEKQTRILYLTLEYDVSMNHDGGILDGWLRMGLPPPPLGNFADISYLVEN